MRSKAILVVVIVVLSVVNVASATIVQGIDIDFVTIANAGNAGDTLVMNDGTTGQGDVGYEYRIGKYEVTNAQWNAFTLAAGAPTGNLSSAYNATSTWSGTNVPVNEVSWLEAAQFSNYLTSGDKSQGVYQWSGDNTNPGDFLSINRDLAISAYGAAYVIPTEDEWYKAAYYTGSGYSTYANGLDTIPVGDNGWNIRGGSYLSPWDVGIGAIEQNGTFDMMGNVWEWNETIIEPGHGIIRGSSYYESDIHLNPSWRNHGSLDAEGYDIGFRVASIPEPTTLLLLGLGAVMGKSKRR